jgi:uncharacterized protein (TIGR02594 family)
MKVALTAADVLKTFKQNGLRLTVISVASTICLGVVDQFTSRVIPSIATRIDNFVDPPRFFVTFNTPLDLASGVTLTALGAADGAPPVPVRKTGERALAAQAGPGVYELRVQRTQNAVKQELVDTKAIDKSGQLWTVDASERNWANAAALRSGGGGGPGGAGGGGTAAAPAAASVALSATRWTLTEADGAVVASVQDPVLRSMLANALAEVGTFEQGTDQEQRRILSYWTGIMEVTSVTMPWSGAFIGWVARQAGAEPPRAAAVNANWRQWGENVEFDKVTPGMVAVFTPGGVGSGFVGIMLRRQGDCVEVIAGNVADRVVITCVKASRLVSVRRPAVRPPDPAPAEGMAQPKGE